MSYASFEIDGRRRVGVVDGEDLIPLEGVESVNAGAQALAAARRDEAGRVALAGVRLLPASPEPRRVICVGLNYRSHIVETQRDDSDYPVLFPKFASSLIGARDDIVAPPESTAVDYEAELAIVIGTAGRRIAAADALDHVLGFTVANDVTMRDYQYRTHQWMQGKAWDASTPLGPVIVGPDAADGGSGRIRTEVNGRIVQDSDLSLMIFDVPTLVSTISEFTTLEPGDVILTGTPAGVGFRREPPLLLGDGDVVAVEIDGIGRIENRVVAEH